MQEFVKPFTKGTGCGVALLLNGQAPKEAQIMMSHTWAEDIHEVQDAVNDCAQDDGRAQFFFWLPTSQSAPTANAGDLGRTVPR